MKKIAIVVQRAGRNIVGGSEDYSMRMAQVLSENYSVDIVTTTARSHLTWENEYNEGIERLNENLNIIRFYVDKGRGKYWHNLCSIFFNGIPLNRFHELEESEKKKYIQRIRQIPEGAQEEWVKFQGPYSYNLLNYLSEKSSYYDKFIFMTYLFPTTYFGVDRIFDRKKVLLCPTFHDEPPAYFSIFKKYKNYTLLFLTHSERGITEKIFEDIINNFQIINFGMQDKFNNVEELKGEKYIVYAGRLEEGKGILTLLRFFSRFTEEYGKFGIMLYLLGDGSIKNFNHPRVKYLGVLNEDEKLKYIKNAVAFVHPSPLESLSISLVEAFMMGTPVIVNKKCAVFEEHISKSNAGLGFGSYPEFSSAMLSMIEDEVLRNNLSKNARKYFLDNYRLDTYKNKLINIIEENE